jgi:hypothetical protein
MVEVVASSLDRRNPLTRGMDSPPRRLLLHRYADYAPATFSPAFSSGLLPAVRIAFDERLKVMPRESRYSAALAHVDENLLSACERWAQAVTKCPAPSLQLAGQQHLQGDRDARRRRADESRRCHGRAYRA